MKTIITTILSALLVGCTVVPVTQKFPEVPNILQEPCPSLIAVQENSESIREVLTVVVKNYTQYHECSFKVDAWNEWYKAQKKIQEELK